MRLNNVGLAAGFVMLCLFSGGIYPFGKKDEAAREAAIQEDKPVRGAGEQADGSPYETAVPGQLVEVTGIIRVVGNEPFSEIVITEEGQQTWYLEEESRALLGRYRQRKIAVRGTVELQEITLANGRYLETRRILKDVSLISPL
ncbi:MAG: hypothetical protein LBP76_13845 [Treponema sp.]|jgi:hypothetical protein|nr:hypothetical protein [Treponema sp.]